jgi:hypothetical protein
MKTPSTKRSQSGLHGLMAKVSARGLAAIDKRSAGYRALVQWRSELEADLGGADALSVQKRALVDLACRTRLYLDSIDGWLLNQASVVDKRRRSALPILGTRMQLAESLTRTLGLLGLQRAEKPEQPIDDFIERVKPHAVESDEGEAAK